MKLLVAFAATVGVSTAVAVSVVVLPITSTPKAAAVEPAPAAPPPTTTPTVVAAAPVAPVVTPPPAPVELARGAQGPDVLRLQERLVQLHYDPGTVDGRYGAETALAVMAFQKVSGLPRTGV